MSQEVKFKTKDEVEIAGDYYKAGGEEGVILLHMKPADRRSWAVFAEKLNKAGFSVLAIDLRGHGGSQGGPEGYKSFSDEEHRASHYDVEAAAEFLRAKGAKIIHLAGASIGANLALEYLVSDPAAESAVLLSPGLDYGGIKTAPFIPKLSKEKRLLMAAGDDDPYSLESVKKLASGFALDANRVLRILKNSGHGTVIFGKRPEFMDELVLWLSKQSG